MMHERMMILEMVDEKRITPDEALILLNALGDTSEAGGHCIECLTEDGGSELDFPMSGPMIERERIL